MSNSSQKIKLITNLCLLMQLMCFTAMALVESYLVYLYLVKQISFFTMITIHFLIVLLLYFVLRIIYRPIVDKRVNNISLLFFEFTGPIGAAVAVVGIAFHSLLKIFFTPQDKELLKELIPQEDENLSDEIYQRLIYGLDKFDSTKLPSVFNDVLVYGSERQKRVVIERMLRFFRVEFSPVLVEALNDKNNSIRVLAATAVARIDKQYSEENILLNKKTEARPNDFSANMELAKHAEEYSRIHFIDEQRRLKYSLIAMEYYKKSVEIDPQNSEVRVSLAQLYYELQRYEEIIECLEPVIESESTFQDQAIKWYLSAMFVLEKYDDIREFTRTKQLVLIENSFEFDQLLYMILMWKKGYDIDQSKLGVV
ncbi:MAG: tetratricopeptide repeat protein [Chlamydiota bacterium]